MGKSHSWYFAVRERIRRSESVTRTIYGVQSLYYSNFGSIKLPKESKGTAPPGSVALCCRIRDEGRFLREFVEYYLAIGIQHLFFYEKLSVDDFRQVLEPYIKRNVVTLYADWPHVPVSPTAEEDCVRRCIGRFEWVGFIDADEFVVVKDGRPIGEFLSEFKKHPGVALHWRMYGSNGHKQRPEGPVIGNYTRREALPNRHVKCFVRPEAVTKNRNPHSWYYRRLGCAVTERHQKVWGSFRVPATAERAWINHYHHKSDQDYFEKASRKSVQDQVGINYPNRTLQRHKESEQSANATFDDSAVQYYRRRCESSGREFALALDSVEQASTAVSAQG